MLAQLTSSVTDPSPAYAIEARGLTKAFGPVQAVAGIDFEVSEGELFGFLGPNGAGKTTTINMLTGLARPDTGHVSIAGRDCLRDPKAAQGLMGIVPDESNLYPELTGLENLAFCGALYGMPKRAREARAKELVALFGLEEAGHRRFGGYSKGMKRRLTIAAGIVHDPPILFLDEPTTGIDVASARHIRRLIGRLNADGTTIFLTTHYIEEAERLCGRIAFIVKGKIVRTDSVEALLQRADNRHVVVLSVSGDTAAHSEAIGTAFPDLRVGRAREPGAVRIEAGVPVQVGPLIRLLEERGAEVFEARRARPSLEDVFVEITGIEGAALAQDRERPGSMR